MPYDNAPLWVIIRSKEHGCVGGVPRFPQLWAINMDSMAIKQMMPELIILGCIYALSSI